MSEIIGFCKVTGYDDKTGEYRVLAYCSSEEKARLAKKKLEEAGWDPLDLYVEYESMFLDRVDVFGTEVEV